MKTFRLARYFELKYSFVSEASEQRVNEVRQAIIDAYNHYVNIDSRGLKPAYNIIPLLAESGEKFSKQITALMEDLVNDIDTIDLHDLFSKIQNVLAVIDELQHGKKEEVRNSIHDMFVMRRDTDKNRREVAKSKFENVVFKKLASILAKQAKALNVLLGKSNLIMGGPTEPEVKEPTKEEQNMFRRTQLAVANHLDDGPVFGQVWSQPDLKRRLIRLINKGKNRWAEISKDPEVIRETSAIIAELKRRQTNEGYFNAPEDVAKEMVQSPFVSPELKRERLQEKNLQEEAKTEEWEKLQEAVRQRDEAHQRRQEEQRKIDEEAELASKYSSTHLEQIMKRYQ